MTRLKFYSWHTTWCVLLSITIIIIIVIVIVVIVTITISGGSKNFEKRGQKQFISSVLIYRKCAQRNISGFLNKIWANRGQQSPLKSVTDHNAFVHERSRLQWYTYTCTELIRGSTEIILHLFCPIGISQLSGSHTVIDVYLTSRIHVQYLILRYCLHFNLTKIGSL